MVRTRVGYCGGTTPNVNYNNMGDYTETTEVDFDPKQVSYEHLLMLFWSYHNPIRSAFSTQYKSAIWYNSPEQEKTARAVKARVEKQRGQALSTEILPASPFYFAEDYHQKYYLRANREVEREFERMYPNEADYINSTAVARANSFAGGDGDPMQLRREIDSYGLSERGKAALLKLAETSHPIKCAF